MERFENILCVVPADPGNDSGLRRALLLADIYQARLTVAQILPEVDSLAHGAGAALLASRAAADCSHTAARSHRRRASRSHRPRHRSIERHALPRSHSPGAVASARSRDQDRRGPVVHRPSVRQRRHASAAQMSLPAVADAPGGLAA